MEMNIEVVFILSIECFCRYFDAATSSTQILPISFVTVRFLTYFIRYVGSKRYLELNKRPEHLSKQDMELQAYDL